MNKKYMILPSGAILYLITQQDWSPLNIWHTVFGAAIGLWLAYMYMAWNGGNSDDK